MSIKDSALRFATSVENELIQIRADQMESNEALTNRINGVANQVKELRADMTGRLEGVEGRLGRLEDDLAGVKSGQAQMLNLLIDIQRRLSA